MSINIEVAQPGDPETVNFCVKPRFFVRFAVVMACNALGIPYTKDLGLTRPLYEDDMRWVHPNARFPLIHQTPTERLEVTEIDDPVLIKNGFQSDVETVTARVCYEGDALNVEVPVGTHCTLLPDYYFAAARQKKPLGKWSFVHIDDDNEEEDVEWNCPVEDVDSGMVVISVEEPAKIVRGFHDDDDEIRAKRPYRGGAAGYAQPRKVVRPAKKVHAFDELDDDDDDDDDDEIVAKRPYRGGAAGSCRPRKVVRPAKKAPAFDDLDDDDDDEIGAKRPYRGGAAGYAKPRKVVRPANKAPAFDELDDDDEDEFVDTRTTQGGAAAASKTRTVV